MSSRDQIIQRLARIYREQNDTDSVDPDGRFGDFLLANGVRPPRVPTPREMLARVAKAALKHEIRRDEVTGQPYRGWHPVPVGEDSATGQRRFEYYDIEVVKRGEMQKAVQLRVSGMVNDGAQVARDAAHWNRINPTETPLAVQEMLDLREQVEWRINGDDEIDNDLDVDGEPTGPSST